MGSNSASKKLLPCSLSQKEPSRVVPFTLCVNCASYSNNSRFLAATSEEIKPMDNSAQQADSSRQSDIDALPEALQRVAQLYAAQPVPRPTSAAKQQLMERLLSEETAVA